MMLVAADVIDRLRAAVEYAVGVVAFARNSGLPQSIISETLHGKREISEGVANALGLIRVQRFMERTSK